MTTPTLQTRLGYVALMMCGVGLMLLAVRGETDRVATIAGLGFVVLGIVLLVTAGGWDLHRRLLTVHESEPADNEVPSRVVLELGDAISGISRVPCQAARSIGGSMGLVASVFQPSTWRMLI